MSDEFVLRTAVVRAFVEDVQATIAAASSPEQACDALRPRFAELLADPHWLPAEYQAAAFPGRVFVPGETPVPVSGKVLDAAEMRLLVDSALDFWLTADRYAAQFEQDGEECALSIARVLALASVRLLGPG